MCLLASQPWIHSAAHPPCLSLQPGNRASYATHISTCAFNSLFAGELVIPDWVSALGQHATLCTMPRQAGQVAR